MMETSCLGRSGVNRLMALLTQAALLVLPVGLAVFVSYGMARHDQETRATLFASLTLDQAIKTTHQIAEGVKRLEALGDPCSSASVRLMRQLDLGSSLLQGFGYVADGLLVCSSIAESQPVMLGPADYRSSLGNDIRTDRQLAFAPGAPLLIVTTPSGYTAFVHPDLIFALSSESPQGASGLVSASARRLMMHRGTLPLDWRGLTVPEGQMEGLLFTDSHMVAWHRAEHWDYLSFSALPLADLHAEFAMLRGPAIAVGLGIGVLLLWLRRWLRKERTSLPSLLRAGLRNGEIGMVFQPLVDMRTGDVIGMEGLVRWTREDGDSVSPNIFVPIAEKHGLIGHLTGHVIARGIAEAAPLLRDRPRLFLSLNISSADLDRPELYDELMAACRLHAVTPDRIHLEITERERVATDDGVAAIATLRGRGFQVGTDDFGVGYSNLHYFDALNLDFIKIDRVLLANAFARDGRKDLVEHIIDLAQSRGIDVVAEGVELVEQRDALLALGVTQGQGWLYYRAMSATDLGQVLATTTRQGGGGPLPGTGTPGDDSATRHAA